MTRLYLLLTVPLLLLCGLLVTLTHTSTYEDADLRAILFPTDCTAPCFMGIRPGVTHGDEALERLLAHPWATNVGIIYRGSGSDENRDGTLSWSWSGNQPAILRAPFFTVGEIEIDGGVVDSIKISTAISFGDIWLLLGRPQRGFLRTSRTYLGRFQNHYAVYEGLEFRTMLPLPIGINDFWSAPVEIRIEANVQPLSPYTLPCWLGCKVE